MSLLSILLLVGTIVSSNSIVNAAPKDPPEAILKFTPKLYKVKFLLNYAINFLPNIVLNLNFTFFRKLLKHIQAILLYRHLRHGTR